MYQIPDFDNKIIIVFLQAVTDDIGNSIPKRQSVKDLLKAFSKDEPDNSSVIFEPKSPKLAAKPIVPLKEEPMAFPPSVPLACSISNVQRMVQQFEDHAIVDDNIDILNIKPLGDRDIADMQDNKTDDDQPDLDTDDSNSGDKSKIKLDVSMEGFTEATDITTPVEMAQESTQSRGIDFDTSYLISDLPEWSKNDIRMATPETHQRLKSETLFDITDLEDLRTDLEDLSDIEENVIQIDAVLSFPTYSDRTLVQERPFDQDEDSSPRLVESKIRMREVKIEEKFERMSMSISDTETKEDGEEFGRLSTSALSKEDEEEAASNFDKIIFDNYVEDKSEDWLTHESDPSPEKDQESGEIFGAPEKEHTSAKQGKQKRILNTHLVLTKH